MKAIFVLVVVLALTGCNSTMWKRDVAPRIVQGVTLYCAESEVLRATIRAEVNAGLAPSGATVKVTCKGDTGIDYTVPAAK